MKRKQLFGSLLLILTAVIWGTAFAFQRSGMEQIEPITFCASRMTLAAAALGPAAFFRKKKHPDSGEGKDSASFGNTLAGGILCGVFLALASVFQQMGIVYTTAGKAGFITALYILIVPVVNLVFFRKRCTGLVWLCVLLGMAGMYLLCMTDRFHLARGDALVCVCAVLYSAHILCCDRFVRKADPIRLSAIQFAAAALISWAAAFLAEAPGWNKIVSAAVPILYCGLVSSGVGYTLQLVAQKYTEPTVASLLMSLESVFAAIAGALLMGERMRPRETLGCAVMFAAILIVQLPLPRKRMSR